MFSGDMQGVFTADGPAASMVRASRLLAPRDTGSVCVGALTDASIFKKPGFADLEFGSWLGAAVPEKTPSTVVTRLNPDIVKAVRTLNGKAKLKVPGFVCHWTSPDGFCPN